MGEFFFSRLLAPSSRPDPYPIYQQMLADAPTSEGPGGMVVLTRHNDCARLLRDQQQLSSDYTTDPQYQEQVAAGAFTEAQLAETDQRWFVFRDPPDHTRLRRLASKAFIPRTEDSLRRRVQDQVNELLERATGAGDGQLDVVRDLALPLPMRIIGDMLGAPAEDHLRMHEWGQAIARFMDPPPILTPEEHGAIVSSHAEMIDYFQTLIDERRSQPGDDLLSRLIAAEESGDHLTTAEINSICRIMVVAGHLTTVSLIANGMLALLRHPTELERLKNSPELAETATDEALRYDPPMHYLLRIARKDFDIDGHPVLAGQTLVLLVAAANRDPERFAEPDRFDITRTDNPHLSFGGGIHYCIAAWLARLEGQVALTTAAQRLVEPELAENVPPYRKHISIRSMESLKVRVSDLRDLAPA